VDATQCREIFAQRLLEAGMPVERNLRLPGFRSVILPIAIRLPYFVVGFDVVPDSENHLVVTESAIPGLPLIELPETLLDEPGNVAVDVALAALLAIGAPETSGAYLRLLGELNIVARGRRARQGRQDTWQPRPCLLKWSDVRSALNGGELIALRTVVRRLERERKIYWALLKRQALAERDGLPLRRV
jgi:hypothetical protein